LEEGALYMGVEVEPMIYCPVDRRSWWWWDLLFRVQKPGYWIRKLSRNPSVSGQQSSGSGGLYESSQRGCATLATVGFMYLVACLGLLGFIANTVRMIWFVGEASDWVERVEFEVGAILVIVFAIVIGSVGANNYPTIQVVENGLRVRVFLWRFVWRTIPWHDVQDVLIPFRQFTNTASPTQATVLVLVKRLTIWHRLLGSSYGVGFEPALPLYPHIYGREDLVLTIARHTGARDWSELLDRMRGWK